MPRMVCTASLVLALFAPALAAGQDKSARNSGAGQPLGTLPEVVVPADAAPAARPAPKVYHFDLSPRAFKPQPFATPTPSRPEDPHVRPAAALIDPARDIVRIDGETSALKHEPPKPPPYDPPAAGEPEIVPAPDGYLTPPGHFGSGWLGGIPTFTHDYCPLYWDDPWQNYCCQRCPRLSPTVVRSGQRRGLPVRLP